MTETAFVSVEVLAVHLVSARRTVQAGGIGGAGCLWRREAGRLAHPPCLASHGVPDYPAGEIGFDGSDLTPGVVPDDIPTVGPGLQMGSRHRDQGRRCAVAATGAMSDARTMTATVRMGA